MNPETEKVARPPRDSQKSEQEPTVVVPLVDEQAGGRIYHPSLLRFALIGGLVGALLLGVVAGWMVDGPLPVAGLGQISSGGTAVAAVAGGGIGLAIGGLAGSLIALYRLPARTIATEAM